MKWKKEKILKQLFSLILVCSSFVSSFSQTEQSKDLSEVTISDQAMEQIVKRVLIWSFKPRKQKTIIYLSDQKIKLAWLPKIKNTEFRLLNSEEVEMRGKSIYFFTELNRSAKTYNIGFAFGSLNCNYFGDNWHFRILKQKVRLWLNGGVGGSCSHSSSF